jgi:hypothetical protein
MIRHPYCKIKGVEEEIRVSKTFKAEVNFRWSLPKSGFRWVDGEWFPEKGDKEIPSLLVENTEIDQTRNAYSPLQEVSALFRVFAEIQPTKEGVLTFANQYGSLGVASFFITASGPAEVQAFGRVGETLDRWASEIARVKEAVTLLDQVRARDEAGLSQVLRWQEGPVEGPFKEFPDSWFYQGTQGTVQVRGAFTASNIFGPALSLITTWANEKLHGHTSLVLTTDQEGKYALELKLGTLLTAIWVQLANAVVEPVDYRKCKTCDRWFAVSDDGRKADQAFCQDACKSKDYRGRKAKAQQMAAEGKSVETIAQAVQTDVKTIKSWLSTGNK